MRHRNLPSSDVELQSYVIWKRLELITSAWSRFVEFLKLFRMFIDFKYGVWMVFHQLAKTERPFFSFAIVILFLFLFGVYGWLLQYCCRPLARNLAFSENNINIERQLLLNELSICPQFELIFKSTVFSLNWAHVEVLSSGCLRNASSLSCKGLSHFSENNEWANDLNLFTI